MLLLFPTLKIHLTESAALKEARLNEMGSELARSEALCARLSQVS